MWVMAEWTQALHKKTKKQKKKNSNSFIMLWGHFLILWGGRKFPVSQAWTTETLFLVFFC